MSKRVKVAETKEVQKETKSLEETKEPKRKRKQPPAAAGSRRSTRNKTTVASYDLDVLIPKVTDAPVDQSLNPMLAGKYDGTQDIKGWLMSEKLDGVRCIWNGEVMKTRNGNLFYPPDFFIEHFPKDTILDGELFLDRGEFQKTISIVRRQDKGDGWKNIKYLVFDAPAIPGPFSKRLKAIQECLSKIDSPYIKFHKHEVCKGEEHLQKEMKRVIALKGEGMMIRDPKAKYEHRRVKTLLKVKEFHDDEATVIGHEKGTGRLEKLMGAVVVKNKAGKTFKVGSGFTDKERASPPKKGTVITYRYFELTKDGVPRFPTYMRVHPGM